MTIVASQSLTPPNSIEGVENFIWFVRKMCELSFECKNDTKDSVKLALNVLDSGLKVCTLDFFL